MEPYLDETAYYDTPNCTWPFGTHIAIVEIDEETGKVDLIRYVAVDDVGKKINPMIVDGQLHGGIAQGVGQALWEGAVYGDDGQLLSGSMLDYAVPRASWFPNFELDETVTPSPVNPLGVKGVGEAGAIASTAAVANAVIDALVAARHPAPRHAVHRRRPCGARSRPRREARHDPGGIRVHPAGLARRGARAPSAAAAKVIAGGQSLLPLLKLRLAAADTLVDIGRLAELQGLPATARRRRRDRRADDVRRVAGRRRPCPAVADAIDRIGDVQVRNRGTIGGAIAHADPASDMPAIAARARRGSAVLSRTGGERVVPLDGFFEGAFTTGIQPTTRSSSRSARPGVRDGAGFGVPEARSSRRPATRSSASPRVVGGERRHDRARPRSAITGVGEHRLPGDGRRGGARRDATASDAAIAAAAAHATDGVDGQRRHPRRRARTATAMAEVYTRRAIEGALGR